MNTFQIKEYWANKKEPVNTYNLSQLENVRLVKETTDFLINCGLPNSCAPFLSFEKHNEKQIPTPNEVFNIDFDLLNDFLMVGSNGSGDPVCIDLNNDNNIVYLNHDNFFESVFINSSVYQLAVCIIKYEKFHTSLNPRIEGQSFTKRRFSDEEFNKVCIEFKEIDPGSLSGDNFWKSELDYLLWERDNE